jgi:hypothetical protein
MANCDIFEDALASRSEANPKPQRQLPDFYEGHRRPTITNENLPDIKFLCEESEHQNLSLTVSEFPEQRSLQGERIGREIVTLKAQDAVLAAQVADLTAQSSREIALLRPLRFCYSARSDFLRRQ